MREQCASGGQERQQICRRARPKRVQFVHVLVQARDPALAILTVKNTEKVSSKKLFALPECLPEALQTPPALPIIALS